MYKRGDGEMDRTVHDEEDRLMHECKCRILFVGADTEELIASDPSAPEDRGFRKCKHWGSGLSDVVESIAKGFDEKFGKD
jgi:hypothetical protein